LWLVEHALPALRRIHHDVHLIIAGRNPAPALAGLRRPECSVVGNPSQAEMNRLIDESNIFVCPTSAGGGVKYKVLDGLRRGIPVVAHQNSCEGYEDAFSVAVRAYKDVETFCEQVGDLLRSLNSEQLRTQEIRRCYAANYSFDSGVRFWNMVLQE
jgi:glycosyltransferase involved in cell wall biosynthesis